MSEAPLELRPNVSDGTAGAVVDFFGFVRGLENEKKITGIEYEAHRRMAEHQMGIIAQSAAEQFDLIEVRIHHRIGLVPVGQPSVMVRVQSGHRSPAFEAARWIMDELKRTVPIWKKVCFAEQPAHPTSATATV